MTIRAPGARLLTAQPFRFLRTLGAGGRKSVDANVALIPFIDFLLTVVVFLLMSFSATGQGFSALSDLPEARHGGALETAPVVTIDGSTITVDGRRVADTPSVAEQSGLHRIDPLVRDLSVLRDNWQTLHPSEPWTGRVILQVARTVDFRVVRHVLFSAGQAGYQGVELAVRDAA